MADIVFEFGANVSEFLKELRDLRQEFSMLATEAQGITKETKEGFQQSSVSAGQFEGEMKKTLKAVMEQKQIIEQMTKKMMELEAAQKSAYGSAGATQQSQKVKELEAQISQLKNRYKEAGEESKRSTHAGTQVMVQFLGVLDAAKAKLAGMKQGSAEFNKLTAEVKAAETAQRKMVLAVDEYGEAVGGSRAELKAYRETLIALKKDGLDNTEMYRNLKYEAGALADAIGDVNQEYKATASDTEKIDRVVRGFQLATSAASMYEGVMALTGQRNEQFEKTLIKLNGLMVISQSLQQVMTELKRKDNVITGVQISLQKTYAWVTGASTASLKLFRAALITTGIGALVAGLGWAISKLKIFSSSSDDAANAQDRLRRKIEGVNNALADQLDNYKLQEQAEINALKRSGKSEEDIFNVKRKWAAKGIKSATESVGEQNKIYAEAQKELSKNNTKENREMVEEAKKARDKGTRELAHALQDRDNMETDFLSQRREKRRGEAKNIVNDSEQQANQALARQKEINKNIIELERQLAQAKIEILKDGYDKEAQAESLSSSNKIADLQAQKSETKDAKTIELIDKNIEQEKKNHTARLIAIQVKYYDDAIKMVEDVQKSINGILMSDQDREINDIEEKYRSVFKEIAEARKKAEESNLGEGNEKIDTSKFDEKEKELIEKQEKEKAAIRAKFNIKALEEQENLALAQNDILLQAGVSEERLTTLKETNKLNILIDFAKKRIEILKALGGNEAELEIAKLEKVIQDSQKKLQKNQNKPKSLMEWLGLSEDDEAELGKYTAAIKAFGETIGDALEGFIKLYDVQIEASQKNIDAIDEKIGKQEDAVSREKDLADQGYANNLQVEEQRLADLERQKEQELKIQEDLKRKKEAMQKAQIIADSLSQVSNLITAASQIFSTMSAIPVVGIGLAIAMIAVMMAGFVAAKAAAYKNVGKAEKGRRVAAGNRHSAGGNKYQSIDGNDPGILEIEEGEWVVNRKSSKKYDPLLEAINNDNFDGMPRIDLIRLLKPMGIHLDEDVPKRILSKYDENTGASKVIVVNESDDKNEWEKQNAILEKIAKGKTVEYYNGYRIETDGNRIRKIIEHD